MCSIFGYFPLDPSQAATAPSSGTLQQMADCMRHRGPDGEGYANSDFASMGMTRLAILDLANGQQPFHSKDKSISAVCNGEIYNYSEIKQELEEAGYSFYTECDSEILPHAYQHWGKQMLQKLNGMFALSILDRNTDSLFLTRDRCGQKPLYYTLYQGVFYFASEIRALHNIGVPKALNSKALPQYLRLRYVPEPSTLFQHIQILPAAHTLTITKKTDPNTVTPSPWWHAKSNDFQIAEDQEAQLYAIQQKAVAQALQADVPIALHLSAGIDSSVLLSEIHQTGTNIQAITAGFSSGSDETLEAQELCNTLDIPHHSIQLNPNDLGQLEQVIAQMELPVGDALILAFDRLAQKTQKIGAKVALGGEGIDEIFGGYSFHRISLYAHQLGKSGRWLAAKVLRLLPLSFINRFSAFPASLGQSGIDKIAHYLEQYHLLDEAMRGIELRSLFSQEECNHLLLEEYQPPPTVPLKGNTLLEKHLRFQFSDWLQDWAIIRQERNSMAHSIEYRMPYLDHQLIEFGFALNDREKISQRTGKSIWRRMAKRFYPETIYNRTKQPFYFPIEDDSYYEKFKQLINTHLSNEKIEQRGLFDPHVVKNLRDTALNTREFLPIKQAISLVIFELWMQHHQL